MQHYLDLFGGPRQLLRHYAELTLLPVSIGNANGGEASNIITSNSGVGSSSARLLLELPTIRLLPTCLCTVAVSGNT